MSYNNLLSSAYTNSITQKGLSSVTMDAMKNIHGKDKLTESTGIKEGEKQFWDSYEYYKNVGKELYAQVGQYIGANKDYDEIVKKRNE